MKNLMLAHLLMIFIFNASFSGPVQLSHAFIPAVKMQTFQFPHGLQGDFQRFDIPVGQEEFLA